MATNDKVRVSTLDDWYLALSKMYNDLKNENKIRYDKDVGKDYDPSSKLNSGAKATASHISHVVNGINALNGKDSEGNIPTDKDDLKVYFWYSDWNTPPGEIKVGDTKYKIRNKLKDDINNTISELKQICVNNSKDKVLMCAEEFNNKTDCTDYICTDNKKRCINTTTINATIPTNSQTYHSTSYNSKTARYNKDTVTTTYSDTPNNTVTKVTSNSKETKYSKTCAENSKALNSVDSYNINCKQVAKPGCSANITNTNWYTNGRTTKNDKTSSNSNNSKYTNTKKNGFSEEVLTKNSVKPDNSKTPIKTKNSTSTSYDETPYGTKARNTVTPNSTKTSYSQNLGNANKHNAVKIEICDKCVPVCSQDIRCKTYNIGYSVKTNEDGTYKTFACSDTNHLDAYLYIVEEKER